MQTEEEISYIKEIQLEMMQQFYKRLEEIESDQTGSIKKGVEHFLGQLNDFFEAVSQKQQLQLKPPIYYINISFLKSYILLHDYKVRIDLYDAQYYLDDNECSTELDMAFILDYMDQDIECILEKYAGPNYKMSSYDMERIKKKYMPVYEELIKQVISGLLPKILYLEGYEKLLKAPEIQIYYGEYLDQTVQIF